MSPYITQFCISISIMFSYIILVSSEHSLFVAINDHTLCLKMTCLSIINYFVLLCNILTYLFHFIQFSVLMVFLLHATFISLPTATFRLRMYYPSQVCARRCNLVFFPSAYKILQPLQWFLHIWQELLLTSAINSN